MGSYPPGCSQSDHDRAFGELGPSPEELFDEIDADEARWEAEEEEDPAA